MKADVESKTEWTKEIVTALYDNIADEVNKELGYGETFTVPCKWCIARWRDIDPRFIYYKECYAAMIYDPRRF